MWSDANPASHRPTIHYEPPRALSLAVLVQLATTPVGAAHIATTDQPWLVIPATHSFACEDLQPTFGTLLVVRTLLLTNNSAKSSRAGPDCIEILSLVRWFKIGETTVQAPEKIRGALMITARLKFSG